MQAALADSLARAPCDLLVDLAAMTFCDVRGLTMLVQATATAGERGIGYAVTAAPRQLSRVGPMLWPAAELPVQYPSAAAGVLAALTRRHDDDLARWAPKRTGVEPKPAHTTTAGRARRVGDRRAARDTARLIEDGSPGSSEGSPMCCCGPPAGRNVLTCAVVSGPPECWYRHIPVNDNLAG
jgi:hypothetical protein